MTRQLFIYWKTDAGNTAAAAAGMAAFQRALLERHAGLVASLYRRAGDTGDNVTLMETYACPGSIAAGLQAEIVAASARASAGWCRGERHVEVFDELHADAGDRPAR